MCLQDCTPRAGSPASTSRRPDLAPARRYVVNLWRQTVTVAAISTNSGIWSKFMYL